MAPESASASALSSSIVPKASCASRPFTPVQIPIRNVSLSDQTLRRGAAISVGSPAQPFAFLLSSYNNTFLNDAATPSCNVNETRLECSNEFRGLFDQGSSTTWNSANYYSLGTADESGGDQAPDLWGSDKLTMNTSLSLPEFPLGLFRGAQKSMNILGLGSNSTLLNSLVSIGVIASSTFGVFHGWTGSQTRYQTDGALTLGGYDAARITGSNVSLPFNIESDCKGGFIVSVTDIKMNLKNGSNPSILGQSAGSAMRACVELDFGTMSLSQDIWWAFTNITGTSEIGRSKSPINYWGMMIPARGAYDGDLTISIYPGLDIRIPNDQLVVPDVQINSQGQEYPSTNASVEVLINSLQDINKNDMPRLGRPFLTSAYLLVDNDHQQFTLWASQQAKTSNIVVIGPPACDTPTPTATPSSMSSNPSSPTLGPSNIPTVPESSSSVPKGAIAGGIVGGLAAIALCTTAFLLRRRRTTERLQREQQQEHEKRTEAMKNSLYSDTSTYYKPEMPSDKHPPQEMPLVNSPGHSLSPYEMQTTREAHEMPATPQFRS